MDTPPDGLPEYRVLTGVDDAAFCRRVSEAVALGYELYGSPAATFNGQNVIVAQALVWPTGQAATQRGFINHLDLTVSDLAASCAFYDKVLGRLGYARTGEYAGEVPCWVLSRSGVTHSIGLHKARVGTPHNRYSAGLHHLAFHLASRAEVDGFHEFLRSERIEILDPPAEYAYTPGYYAVFFADPDGIKLELVHEPRLDDTAA